MLWGQAGNAALLAGDAAGARRLLDRALVAGSAFPPAFRAGWLVDRARAAIAGGYSASARRDLDAALALTPDNASALLVSAGLAFREGDGPRARNEIVAARRLAPADPDIAAEARRIGIAAADSPGARAVRETGSPPGPY